MELKDLVGVHRLSGIDTGKIEVKDRFRNADTCTFVRFTLDGINYLAVEDPDDGYRSVCKDLVISEEKPSNMFSEIEVNCYMAPDDAGADDRGGNDILVLEDVLTKKVVLKVGTDYNDEYYPWFVFEYHPENMILNKRAYEEAMS